MTQLDCLEALAEKATPRPWKAADPLDPAVTMWAGASRGAVEDAEFITAAINVLPDLIRVARAAKAYRTEWRRPGPEANFPQITATGQQLDDVLAPLFAEVES